MSPLCARNSAESAPVYIYLSVQNGLLHMCHLRSVNFASRDSGQEMTSRLR